MPTGAGESGWALDLSRRLAAVSQYRARSDDCKCYVLPAADARRVRAPQRRFDEPDCLAQAVFLGQSFA